MAEGAEHLGTITVNGSVYDIIENTRVEQPSILGTQTFQQYFSIRRDTRNSGIINITEHFEAWELLGLELGKMYEVSFVVEGYQSSGNFNFTELDVLIDDGTGIKTEGSASSEEVLIYPNPNNGDLMIEVNEAIQNTRIRIFDMLGKTVYSLDRLYEKKLQVSDLNQGMYFVHLNSDKVNSINKVLVR
jgi:endo-1,4-beta-xylanase